MADMDSRHDFFETDEPVDKIVSAFQRGEKGRTGLEAGRNRYLPSPVDRNTLLTNYPTATTKQLADAR